MLPIQLMFRYIDEKRNHCNNFTKIIKLYRTFILKENIIAH